MDIDSKERVLKAVIFLFKTEMLTGVDNRSATAAQKIEFLKSKGMTDAEIQEAIMVATDGKGFPPEEPPKTIRPDLLN